MSNIENQNPNESSPSHQPVASDIKAMKISSGSHGPLDAARYLLFVDENGRNKDVGDPICITDADENEAAQLLPRYKIGNLIF